MYSCVGVIPKNNTKVNNTTSNQSIVNFRELTKINLPCKLSFDVTKMDSLTEDNTNAIDFSLDYLYKKRVNFNYPVSIV